MTKYAMRSMYVAPKDHLLVEWDLSQAETWITAYLAREEKMKFFLHNSDIHTETASFVDKVPKDQVTPVSRYKGKKANHSLSYGSSYLRLAQSINAESDSPPYVTVSLVESKRIFDAWHMLYIGIHQWQQEIQEQTKWTRTLVTPHGRERTFYAEWGPELWKEMYANIPQSTVADHLNGMVQDELGVPGGLLEVKRRFLRKGIERIVYQGHDSFGCEIHKNNINSLVEPVTALIKRPMIINGEVFTIPVDCKQGERWGELEKI